MTANKNDVSGDRIDLLKNSSSLDNDAASVSDDVKYVKPLAKLENITKVPIADINWVLNDMFIMIITAKNEIALMDGMLYAYGLQNSQGNHQALKMTPGKALAKLE